MAEPSHVVLILGQAVSPRLAKSLAKETFVVGVDAGAFYCLEHGIAMDEAIGDFDSVSPSGLALLKDSGTKIIELPVMKDDTDTEYALKRFKNALTVTVVGGLQGKRVEHLVANLLLLDVYPNASFIDDNSFVTLLKAGQQRVFAKKDYRFLSVFPLQDSLLKSDGLLYSYPDKPLPKGARVGISNEFVSAEATLEVVSGKVLVILSEDDPKF